LILPHPWIAFFIKKGIIFPQIAADFLFRLNTYPQIMQISQII